MPVLFYFKRTDRFNKQVSGEAGFECKQIRLALSSVYLSSYHPPAFVTGSQITWSVMEDSRIYAKAIPGENPNRFCRQYF